MPDLLRVTAALVPAATLLVTVRVATVEEVCSTVMPVMFDVNAKSWPATVLIVDASIVPEVAVTLNVLVLVVPEAETAVSVKAGMVASTGIDALTANTVVETSPVGRPPYSTV